MDKDRLDMLHWVRSSSMGWCAVLEADLRRVRDIHLDVCVHFSFMIIRKHKKS